MPAETATWTVAKRDQLPYDGTRQEVVAGELFVTPAPSFRHQVVVNRLYRLVYPYVEANGLGIAFELLTDVIFSKRDVVMPDLVVLPIDEDHPPAKWADAPKPILVAEVRSPTTWWRDVGPKYRLYRERELPEYWIVDHEVREVTVVRPGRADERVSDILRWHPAGAGEALEIPLRVVFR